MKTIAISKGYKILVDDCDFDYLKKFNWFCHDSGHRFQIYAHRNCGTKAKPKIMLMHREIMKAKKGEQVDHVDGNSLNNCQNNLRLCSFVENKRNQRKRKLNATSRFKGVMWDKDRKLWKTRIGKDGKSLMLGRFKNEEDAAIVYDVAAQIFFGSFACCNFP